MLNPYKIKWKNISSLEMDCHTGISLNSDNGESDTFLNKDAIISESYNGALQKVHGYKWNQTFAPQITLIKENYEDFTPSENQRILAWLTSSKKADFLDVYRDDSEVISFSILGNFTSVSQQKLANGRIIGYVVTFTGVAPFAFSALKTVTQDVSDPINNTITLNIKTDDVNEPIYPRITIQQNAVTSVVNVNYIMTEMHTWVENTVYYNTNANEYYWVDAQGVKHTSNTNDSGFESTSVTISNTYKDRDGTFKVIDTTIKNNIKGETIVLDGANKVISSSRMNGRVFGDDFDWTWLPLVLGQNTLTVTGNCTVTIEWREPIKTGDF